MPILNFLQLKMINNLMKKLYFVLIALLAFQYNTFSQHKGNCGVSTEDQIIIQRLFKHNHEHVDLSKWDRNQIIDVPVKFHVFANTDGSGRIPITAVLNQLCVLNNDFAAHNIRFYLSGDINFVNSTNPNNDPGLFENQLASRRVNNAVNVYVTRNAVLPGGNPGEGLILGYYSPSRDWIVVRQDQVTAANNTLSHEMGHFFSLPHTFFGWESDPYDEAKHGNPVLLQNAPGSNIPVELMDGTNCNLAADRLCDTPPDYGFGNLTNTCFFNRDIRDRNNERILPMVNNQMSYFSNCNSFIFTPNQGERMNVDYLTPRRAYLRTGYHPVNQPITSAATPTQPVNNVRIDSYNGVHFIWTPVPNATHYILEVIGALETTQYLTTGTEFYATDLRPNGLYNWRVRAFNEGFSCTSNSENGRFRTGNVVTSVTDTDFIQKLTVFPNPAIDASSINISFHLLNSGPLAVQISDATGRRVFTKRYTILDAGDHIFPLEAYDLQAGIYMLELITTEGIATKKIIISR